MCAFWPQRPHMVKEWQEQRSAPHGQYARGRQDAHGLRAPEIVSFHTPNHRKLDGKPRSLLVSRTDSRAPLTATRVTLVGKPRVRQEFSDSRPPEKDSAEQSITATPGATWAGKPRVHARLTAGCLENLIRKEFFLKNKSFCAALCMVGCHAPTRCTAQLVPCPMISSAKSSVRQDRH